MKKLRLVIVSERTRYHFQKPLSYFKKLEIIHLYKSCYPDMKPKDFGPNLFKYNNIFELYRKLKDLKPDLLQGLEPYYGYSRFKIPIRVLPILITPYLFCRFNQVPYFFHVLENITPCHKYGRIIGPLMQQIARWCAARAAFVFYLNKGAKKNLKKMKVPESKMVSGLWGVWGVDIKTYRPAHKILKKKSILFAGRLIEQKGILELIEAMGYLSKKYPQIELLIAGEGELKSIIRQKIKTDGLKDKVILLGNILSHEMPKIYRKACLFVSPSRSLNYSAEQIGMVNIEAMASGLPVISTKTGSIAEFVLEEKTGLLVQENSPKQLAEAIMKMSSNPGICQKFSKAGRELALYKYNAKQNVWRLEQTILTKLSA